MPGLSDSGTARKFEMASKLEVVAMIQGFDEEKEYLLCEAINWRDTFIRMVLKQSGDVTCWFALYDMDKVRGANHNILILDREKLNNKKFEDKNELVDFMESLFSAMGYKIQRRSNWEIVKEVDAEKLVSDANHMVNLLYAEYQWEDSIRSYYAKDRNGPSKPYKVIANAIFTPSQDWKPRPLVKAEDVKLDVQQQDVVMETVERNIRQPSSKDET
jgi:hypothetical protein